MSLISISGGFLIELIDIKVVEIFGFHALADGRRNQADGDGRADDPRKRIKGEQSKLTAGKREDLRGGGAERNHNERIGGIDSYAIIDVTEYETDDERVKRNGDVGEVEYKVADDSRTKREVFLLYASDAALRTISLPSDHGLPAQMTRGTGWVTK